MGEDVPSKMCWGEGGEAKAEARATAGWFSGAKQSRVFVLDGASDVTAPDPMLAGEMHGIVPTSVCASVSEPTMKERRTAHAPHTQHLAGESHEGSTAAAIAAHRQHLARRQVIHASPSPQLLPSCRCPGLTPPTAVPSPRARPDQHLEKCGIPPHCHSRCARFARAVGQGVFHHFVKGVAGSIHPLVVANSTPWEGLQGQWLLGQCSRKWES